MLDLDRISGDAIILRARNTIQKYCPFKNKTEQQVWAFLKISINLSIKWTSGFLDNSTVGTYFVPVIINEDPLLFQQINFGKRYSMIENSLPRILTCDSITKTILTHIEKLQSAKS